MGGPAFFKHVRGVSCRSILCSLPRGIFDWEIQCIPSNTPSLSSASRACDVPFAIAYTSLISDTQQVRLGRKKFYTSMLIRFVSFIPSPWPSISFLPSQPFHNARNSSDLLRRTSQWMYSLSLSQERYTTAFRVPCEKGGKRKTLPRPKSARLLQSIASKIRVRKLTLCAK